LYSKKIYIPGFERYVNCRVYSTKGTSGYPQLQFSSISIQASCVLSLKSLKYEYLPQSTTMQYEQVPITA